MLCFATYCFCCILSIVNVFFGWWHSRYGVLLTSLHDEWTISLTICCIAHVELTNHVATGLNKTHYLHPMFSLLSSLTPLCPCSLNHTCLFASFCIFFLSSLSFTLPHIPSPCLITFSPSSHTVPQAGRVPVGAAATQHNLNDLIVIHSIPLQQRNLGVLDRNQYGHILLF